MRWVVLLTVCAGTGAIRAEPSPAGSSPAVEGQVLDHLGAGVVDVHVALFPKEASTDAPAIAVGSTNRYGDFALAHTGELSGAYVIVFRKKGYTEARRNVDIVPGEAAPFVDLILTGGMKLHGSVVDAATGSAVEKARVRVEAAGRDWNTVTNADGSFSFDRVLPGSASVSARAAGFARYREVFQKLEFDKPVRIALKPQRRCQIVVKDWQGHPVADVRVECLDDHIKDQWTEITNTSGVVDLRGLSREATSLRVRLTHPNYVSDAWYDRIVALPEDATESTHTLTLLTAGGVRGTITLAGSDDPLNGVRVTVGADVNKPQPRGWTDLAGQYAVTGVPPGDTVVTVYLRGYAPELRTIEVEPNDTTTLNLTLRPSKNAAGVVVNSEGQPVAGAYVIATRWKGYETLGIQAVTNDDGRFGFDTVPNDPFLVQVVELGGTPLEDQEITPGKLDHRIQLPKVTVSPPTIPSGPKVGEAFPAIALTTLEGKPFTFADLAGKYILVDFWATWCGPCVQEMPALVSLYEKFGQRADFAMVNVSIDMDGSDKAVRRFIKKHKMKWVNIFGGKAGAQKLADACGVSYVPRKFLVAPDGNVLLTELDGSTLIKTISKYLKPSETEREKKSN